MDESELLDRIDTAVGQTCYWWSRIEHLVHDLCLHLASCLSVDFDKSENRVPLHIALTNMDMRQRIATAKAFASQAPTADNTFFDRIERCLNRIDNELRIERNRYVHDFWGPGDELGTVERFQQKTVVTKPQSRTRELEIGTTKIYTGMEEVEAFVLRLEEAFRDLCEFDGETAEMAAELSRLLALRGTQTGN